MTTSDEMFEIGPFRVGKCIGRGGMGEVFEGIHRTTQVEVAIKFIPAGSDPETTRAVYREVRSHASLVHPGVVYLLDYGTVDVAAAQSSNGALAAGSPYVVMELARRGTVSDQMPFEDWPSVRRILLQVLDALAFAHARGVIHRDLKPENLLLFDTDAEATRVKLADFGVAHAMADESELGDQELSQLVGTPLYMAPEQIYGEWRRFGPWTDLYALGCVAWHLICGRAPFVAESVSAIARQHCFGARPPLVPRFPVPDGVEQWIERSMSCEPEERFRCAADAAWALPGPDLPALIAGVADSTESVTAAPGDPTMTMTSLDWQEAPDQHVEIPTAEFYGGTQSVDVKLLDEPASTDVDMTLTCEDLRPPLPDSWRTPRSEKMGTPLVDTGLGLFGLREVPFVDRDDERDRIWRALRGVVDAGELRVVFVVGESGVGKSRLARWMVTRAHEVGAAQVLRSMHGRGGGGRAEGLGGLIQRAFRTWRLSRAQLYEDLLGRLPPLGEADRLLEHDARALTEIVHPTDDSAEVEGPRYKFSSPAQGHALMARLLRRLGQRHPPVVWLDDVQYDADAFGFIEYLVNTLDERPAGLILATVRADVLADNAELAGRLAELDASELCECIDVEAIGPDDHRELIDRMLPLAPAAREMLAERTEGNPLFAHQLLSAWIDEDHLVASDDGFQIADVESLSLPDDIHQMWTGRLDRLCAGYAGGPGESQASQVVLEVIELAAALGRDVDEGEWRALCAAAHHVVPADLVAVLVERGLATGGREGWSFAHGLLIESIERRAVAEGRWREHQRNCARMLEERYPERRAQTARRRTEHWIAAGEHAQALASLLEAARWANQRGDPGARIELLARRGALIEELALPQDDRRRVENTVEDALRLMERGQFERVESSLERAILLAEQRGWARLRGRANYLLGHALFRSGQADAALHACTEAQRHFRALGERAEVADCLRLSAWVALQLLQDSQRAERLLSDARATFTDIEDIHGVMRCEIIRCVLLQSRGDFARTEEVAHRLIDHCREHGNPLVEAHATNSLGEMARLQGRWGEALEHYRRATALKASCGSIDSVVNDLNVAQALMGQEEFEEAEAVFEPLVERLPEAGSPQYRSIALLGLVGCAAALEEWAKFDDWLARAQEDLREYSLRHHDQGRLAALGADIAIERGADRRADELLELARDLWQQLGETAMAEAAAEKRARLAESDRPGADD